jgi:hypothetical protein
MRRNWRTTFVEMLGRKRLEEMWEGAQQIWVESADLYRRQGLRDGHGLTGYRHDRYFKHLKDMCDRDPLLFAAFDYDRRRTRAFAIIESSTTILTAAITRTRSEWVPAAMSRFANGRQLSFLNPVIRVGDPLTALLMLVNGAPAPRKLRELPIAMLVRLVEGESYSGEVLNLDAEFAKKPSIISIAPRVILHPPKAPAVSQEVIVMRKKLTNLKRDLNKEKEGS